MSADQIRVVRWAIESEIRAFKIDLANPKRAPRENDVRVSHLRLLESALTELKP